jgi:hypothetical protein
MESLADALLKTADEIAGASRASALFKRREP